MRTSLSVNNKEFSKQCIHEGKRIDGRGIYDFRAVKITFGVESGHVEAQLGQTRVFVAITSEVVEPFPDRPTEGFFLFNTEFSPMASPSFEEGRPSEYAIELGRVIERGLRESRAIDTEALCIRSGEKVWKIKCNIIILDDGGNLLDCASIAAITALLHFRRPEVTTSGDTVQIHEVHEREPVPLSIHHIPICVTFGFFEQGEYIVIDPNFAEEQVMEGKMTLTLNIHREVCSVQKAGGTPIDVSTIIRCSKIAAVKAAEITSIIQKALESDPSRTKNERGTYRRAGQQIQLPAFTAKPQPQKAAPKESMKIDDHDADHEEGHQERKKEEEGDEEEEEEEEPKKPQRDDSAFYKQTDKSLIWPIEEKVTSSTPVKVEERTVKSTQTRTESKPMEQSDSESEEETQVLTGETTFGGKTPTAAEKPPIRIVNLKDDEEEEEDGDLLDLSAAIKPGKTPTKKKTKTNN